jgi:hypothetical protein
VTKYTAVINSLKTGKASVHLTGCRHLNLNKEECGWSNDLDFIHELAAVLSGLQDDGFASFTWTVKTAPCIDEKVSVTIKEGATV